MYDSVNLSLSKKKIIKKTLETWFSGFMLFILVCTLMFSSTMLILSFISPELQNSRGLASSMVIFFTIVFLALITFFIWLYQYYYYKLYYYNFTEDGAEIRKGVFSRATGHIRYEKLQNIYVDQDFLDRIFGLYDVHYETAGETSGFYSHVDGLNQENSEKLIAFLNEKARGGSKMEKTATSVKTAKASQKSAKKITKEPASQYDNVVLTRENCPMDKKLVWSQIIGGVIGGAFLIAFFAFFYWITERNNLSYSWNIFWIVIGIFLVLNFIWSTIYTLIWFKNFYFKFDNEKGEITSRVIGMSTSYLYYDRIQNVNINQGFFERLFGLYTVSIETAGEASSLGLVLTGFRQEQAELLKNYFLEKAKSYKKNI